MSRLLTTATTLSVVIGTWAAESDERTEPTFINPIITEEVMRDEPRDILRLGTDFRQRNAEANAALPYVETCFGLIERFGATVNVPIAYHKVGSGAAYGLGDVSAILKYLAIRHSVLRSPRHRLQFEIVRKNSPPRLPPRPARNERGEGRGRGVPSVAYPAA